MRRLLFSPAGLYRRLVRGQLLCNDPLKQVRTLVFQAAKGISAAVPAIGFFLSGFRGGEKVRIKAYIVSLDIL
jgi:hypothetical protein